MLLAIAAVAYFWFLASLRARLIRYDPDGLFASVVAFGGAAFIVFETGAVLLGRPQFAALAAACATTVIFGSSFGALWARKVPRWFGYGGIAGGVAVLIVGLVEGAADWTLAGHTIFASTLGFFIWVIVTATYLLKR
jgi:hypothetical protein